MVSKKVIRRRARMRRRFYRRVFRLYMFPFATVKTFFILWYSFLILLFITVGIWGHYHPFIESPYDFLEREAEIEKKELALNELEQEMKDCGELSADESLKEWQKEYLEKREKESNEAFLSNFAWWGIIVFGRFKSWW